MRLFATALVVLAMAATAHAGTGPFTLDAVDRGWYDNFGSHDPLNDNYAAGQSTGPLVRNWFVFDLTAIPSGIVSLELRLFNPVGGYVSRDPTETYTNYDVSTDIASLIDGTGGVGAYDDLGSGTVYGDVVVSEADNGTFVSIFLNAAAIADADLAVGGLFAIGGAISTLGGDNEIIFAFTGDSPFSDTQLIVKIPEPATLTVLAAMGLGVRRRRR